MRILFVIIFYLISLCACKTTSPKLEAKVVQKATVDVTQDGDKILFISYKIEIDSISKAYKAQLLSKNVVNGKLKRPSQKHELQKQDFRCVLLDAEKQELDFMTLRDPMSRIVEYVQSDGLLAKKTVYLDSTNIAFRIQVAPRTQFIELELVGKTASASKILIQTPIH